VFESISFCTQNKNSTLTPLDIGALVECMLFYKSTHVVANQAILKQLVNYFGIARLTSLIDEQILTITYTESIVGIFTNSIAFKQYHEVIEASSPQHKFQDEIRKICIETTGKDGKGRRQANRFQDKVRVTKHDSIILDGARRSILDQTYLQDATRIILDELTPEAKTGERPIFETELRDSGILVHTNIDFVQLNKIYHQRVSPSHSSLTPAYILSLLLEVEKELYFSSSNLSELATSNLSSRLAEAKIDYTLAKSTQSRSKLNGFTEFLFHDAKAIREAVNTNKIDRDDLVKVLVDSKKFKAWLSEIQPSNDLIREYHKAVTHTPVLDKLPSKTMRWTLFTGLGIAADVLIGGGLGTATGVTVGALDTFLLSRLRLGWKPNQFIEEGVGNLIQIPPKR
jgi:hypothetical protein